MKPKIDYKDLIITTILQAVMVTACFKMVLSFSYSFGIVENPIHTTVVSIVYAFMFAFFTRFYSNYRLQKIQIKQILLQTFEN
jgi:hypothetical protein